MKFFKKKRENIIDKVINKKQKRKINISLFWVFWILFLEFVYRYFIIGNIFNINSLYVILFSIPWIIIFSTLGTLFNEKINKIVNIILLLCVTIVTLAQIVYYNFYDSIFSFFSLTTGTGQVMQFWSMIIEVIIRIWYIFAIILIPLILFLIFNSRLFNYKRIKLVSGIVNIVIFILACGGIFLSIYYSNDDIYSLKRLILKTHAPMLTINQTGLLSMEAIDVYRYTFGFEEEIISVSNDDEVILDNTKEYNIYDIDYESLINNSAGTLNSMHRYFSNVEPTEKNKYTGLFKNKNLIFITAEGFDAIALDENITPTLYKIANNSFVFTNYYQPLFPVSTSDGEYMNLVGLIPKEGVWSFYKSSKISMPLGFGNMFKKAGYTSYGFHDHNYKYYDRHLSHPNIGLTYIGCGNGLQKLMNCKHWPNSDVEMMDATIGYYLNDEKPFATYYMTVSGHLNYNFGGNNMAYRNKDAVSDLSYSTAVKAYLATQIEFDKAMEKLINYLDEAGKLEDTLIVVSPDHYPYGLKKSEMNEISQTDRSDKFENYHTTLIMYNPSIEKTVINKTVSSIDILPTIYNLYGLNFDSRLLMGTDIFSEKEGIVILSDRSWITDKGKYNSVNGTFISTTDEEVTQDYINSINDIVNQKFSMSALILDNNYYSTLGIE